jgi:hypothetical protein
VRDDWARLFTFDGRQLLFTRRLQGGKGQLVITAMTAMHGTVEFKVDTEVPVTDGHWNRVACFEMARAYLEALEPFCRAKCDPPPESHAPTAE